MLSFIHHMTLITIETIHIWYDPSYIYSKSLVEHSRYVNLHSDKIMSNALSILQNERLILGYIRGTE